MIEQLVEVCCYVFLNKLLRLLTGLHVECFPRQLMRASDRHSAFYKYVCTLLLLQVFLLLLLCLMDEQSFNRFQYNM